MSKKEMNRMYIYVDVFDGEFHAGGDMYHSKMEAKDDWHNYYGDRTTNQGFFLEVLVPEIKDVIQEDILKIPTYTI